MANRSNPRLAIGNIEILSIPAPIPNRINEDAWLALEFLEPPGFAIAAVIDGAGARKTLPPLEEILRQRNRGLSAAAYAAGTVRVNLIAQFAAQPGRSLRSALLSANQALQSALAEVLGAFSLELILEKAGMAPEGDARRARLALPACVVTLVRLNYGAGELEYVHAGDTGLFEIRRDGSLIRHTSDQMGPYDQEALRLAANLQQTRELPYITDAVQLPEVQKLNIENGLRHNFVDAKGQTSPDSGCGVINGLPELADYIEQGILKFNPTRTVGYCLLTDGLELLAPLQENAAQASARLRRMGAILEARGLRGLYETVHKMAEADHYCDAFPRMKAQDDATGVFLRLFEKI